MESIFVPQVRRYQLGIRLYRLLRSVPHGRGKTAPDPFNVRVVISERLGQTQPRVCKIDGDMLHLNTASPIRAGKEMNSFPTWKRAEPCANPAALRMFGRQRLIPGAGNAGDFGLSAFLDQER
jgi:hypothetical protein